MNPHLSTRGASALVPAACSQRLPSPGTPPSTGKECLATICARSAKSRAMQGVLEDGSRFWRIFRGGVRMCAERRSPLWPGRPQNAQHPAPAGAVRSLRCYTGLLHPRPHAATPGTGGLALALTTRSPRRAARHKQAVRCLQWGAPDCRPVTVLVTPREFAEKTRLSGGSRIHRPLIRQPSY